MHLSHFIDEMPDCGRYELGPMQDGSAAAAAVLPANEGVLRRKFRIGTCALEIREILTKRGVILRPAQNTVTVVSVLAGALEISEGSMHGTAERDSLLVLAGSEALPVVWEGGSRAFILSIPRSRIQAAASHWFGGPRRLAAITIRLRADQLDREMTQILAWFVDRVMDDNDLHRSFGSTLETRFADGLVKAIGNVSSLDDAFPLARSVQRAMSFAEQRHGIGCTPETLARVAGVMPATLRQNFRACLGTSMTSFVQNVRLDFVRHFLLSGTDSRPIREIARAADFNNLSVFSRSYQMRFGETPSQTRAGSRNKTES